MLIPDAQAAWLAQAEPGSRLARSLTTGEYGHLYPDVKKTPKGWEIVATKEEAP